MGKTDDNIAKDISDLRAALLDGTVPIKVQPQGNYESDKQEERTPKPVDSTVSALKQALIEGNPKLVTDNMLPYQFVSRFEEMHKELKKELSTELWEAAGFDTIGAAVEKSAEKSEEAGKYWVAAFASLLIPAILAGIGLVLLTRFTAVQRVIQGAILNGISRLSRGRVARDLILAKNDNGDGYAFQNKNDVKRREDAAAAGVPLADLPDEQKLRDLKQAIGNVTTKIKNFNTEVRKLPNARSLDKTATAVGKVNTAITAAVPTRIGATAEKLEKLAAAVEKYNEHSLDTKALDKANKAVGKSDPIKVADLAKATGKLAGAQRHFKPDKLPNAGNLRSAARAATDLAKAGGDVTQAFNAFRIAVQRADSAL
ncbi:hypothetical protein ACFY8P_22400 [Streptomyces sp. NPDC012693]|jgi:hypothetical protein|uniref:hypothetical protein n=1 Tax=unclassified Streptomyces TaxID=2593676 RepID=UPI00202ECBD4|nr:hypothetical protein [Streptomyces sp. MSC1_001]